MNKLTELSQSRELVLNLTLRELRGKYKRGPRLGVVAAQPAGDDADLHRGLRRAPEGADPRPATRAGCNVFALFLLCGLLPWNFLPNSMTGGMEALVGNANLVKKVYFPREVLVVANRARRGCSRSSSRWRAARVALLVVRQHGAAVAAARRARHG